MPDLRPFHEVVSEKLFNSIQGIQRKPLGNMLTIRVCLDILAESQMPVEAAHRIGNALLEKGVAKTMEQYQFVDASNAVQRTIENLLSRGV